MSRENASVSRLQDLVETSASVAATRSRREKIEHLAGYLRALEVGDVAPSVAYLAGIIPQGALGVGWATIGELPEPAQASRLRIQDVAKLFDELVGIYGPGSNTRRKQLVGEVMAAATGEEQEFLHGLMTGGVRQGALEGIMVEAVARAADVPRDLARRANMLNGRIWEVAELALTGGEAALREVGLTLFRPVKPMLAQSDEEIGDALARAEPAAVEWKLDGIRIQVHRLGPHIEIYTRNLNPVTDRLGEITELVRGFPSESFVLDGEALFFDGDEPGRFQETAGRFGTDARSHRGLRVFFFDILHADGQDLIDLPLRRRRPRLEELAHPHVVPHRGVGTVEEAEAVLGESLERRHEGVVVKSLGSTYQAGRRGASWIKVKPVHTLDLVVLGAEWGHGRRQGWLSNLHLGARDDDGFVMVGKTFKGLTDELLEWQTERFQEIEDCRSRSTVYLRPELVVEIALDGVQVSTRYPGGVALRFARVRGYRPDKGPEEADTIKTVRDMARLPPPSP